MSSLGKLLSVHNTISSSADDNILEALGPLELARLSKTSSVTRDKVLSYCGRKYKLEVLLERFFNPTEVSEFRQLMADFDIVISGSTALQFIESIEYPDSDLDLYVLHTFADVICRWLEKAGYVFQPVEGDDVKTLAQLISCHDVVKPQTDTFSAVTLSEGYFGAKAVITFRHPLTMKEVQIITASSCPLQLLLSFHSTCPTNMITYAKAYSIYPLATFGQRRSLAQPLLSNHDQSTAMDKYALRGWTIIDKIPQEEMLDPYSAFAPGPRRLGDSLCWTMELLPRITTSVPYTIEAHTWNISYSRHRELVLDTSVFSSPCLQHSYLLAPLLSRRKFLENFKQLKDSHPSDQFLDMYILSIYGDAIGAYNAI